MFKTKNNETVRSEDLLDLIKGFRFVKVWHLYLGFCVSALNSNMVPGNENARVASGYCSCAGEKKHACDSD